MGGCCEGRLGQTNLARLGHSPRKKPDIRAIFALLLNLMELL